MLSARVRNDVDRMQAYLVDTWAGPELSRMLGLIYSELLVLLWVNLWPQPTLLLSYLSR